MSEALTACPAETGIPGGRLPAAGHPAASSQAGMLCGQLISRRLHSRHDHQQMAP
jgi:hypothetical protein